jgi:hypothetical protein
VRLHAAFAARTGTLKEVQPDGSVQSFIASTKTTLNQVADHRDEFIQTCSLRGHLGIMRDRNHQAVVLLDFKEKLLTYVVHGAEDYLPR